MLHIVLLLETCKVICFLDESATKRSNHHQTFLLSNSDCNQAACLCGAQWWMKSWREIQIGGCESAWGLQWFGMSMHCSWTNANHTPGKQTSRLAQRQGRSSIKDKNFSMITCSCGALSSRIQKTDWWSQLLTTWLQHLARQVNLMRRHANSTEQSKDVNRIRHRVCMFHWRKPVLSSRP
mgnify:CR=1 FL=1